jgi:hypothetical protein
MCRFGLFQIAFESSESIIRNDHFSTDSTHTQFWKGTLQCVLLEGDINESAGYPLNGY